MTHREESGQVAVEQALVMPMMVFLILGIVQLTMMQQARVMTEYAAFCAARTGVVWNGDPDKMEMAATIALIPTLGRSDDLKHLLLTGIKAGLVEKAGQLASNAADSIVGKLGLGGKLGAGIKNAAGALKMVRVTIRSPKPSVFKGKIAKHLNGKQIDFDDVRKDAVQANLLSIHLRYYYPMRVPFANWMISTMWLTSVGGSMILYKSYLVPEGRRSIAFAATGVSERAVEFAALAKDLSAEMLVVMAAREKKHYYLFPINTYYTMRMQSNLYLANVQKASGN